MRKRMPDSTLGIAVIIPLKNSVVTESIVASDGAVVDSRIGARFGDDDDMLWEQGALRALTHWFLSIPKRKNILFAT
jgi:surface antigen